MDASVLLKAGIDAIEETLRNLDGWCPCCGLESGQVGAAVNCDGEIDVHAVDGDVECDCGELNDVDDTDIDVTGHCSGCKARDEVSGFVPKEAAPSLKHSHDIACPLGEWLREARKATSR